MREKKPYTVLCFHRSSDFFALEQYCLKNGLPGRMIPLPREISSGCGLAWRVPDEEYDKNKEAFERFPVPPSALVRLRL